MEESLPFMCAGFSFAIRTCWCWALVHLLSIVFIFHLLVVCGCGWSSLVAGVFT